MCDAVAEDDGSGGAFDFAEDCESNDAAKRKTQAMAAAKQADVKRRVAGVMLIGTEFVG